MFQPIRTDPPPDQVRRITLVPFLTDGRLDNRAVSPADGIAAGHFPWWSFVSGQRA
jgi:hypothetical protein